MANREACELYIEQEIKAGLESGKKPWTIGKELSKWVEKMFEVTIKPNTLTQRAKRIVEKSGTNVPKNSKVIDFTCNLCGDNFECEVWHCENCDSHPMMNQPRCPVCRKPRLDRKPQGGWAREGAGRPKHTETHTVTFAQEFATMAISQLERIKNEDPERVAALNRVITWCEKEIKSCK